MHSDDFFPQLSCHKCNPSVFDFLLIVALIKSCNISQYQSIKFYPFSPLALHFGESFIFQYWLMILGMFLVFKVLR